MSTDPISHAVNILKAFNIEPRPVDRLIDSYLNRHREIGAPARRLIYEVVFGVMRWRRRLDGFLTLMGRRRCDERDRILCYLKWKRPAIAGHVPYEEEAKTAGIVQVPFDEVPKNFPGGEAAFVSFPDFLYQKFVETYGREGARGLALYLNEPAPFVLRANLLRVSRDELIGQFSKEELVATPTIHSPYGIILDRRCDLNTMPIYKNGVVEVQDEASQLSVILSDPKRGESVLDACAGAGGKSLMLAMLMKNEGRIVALDTNQARLRILKKRAARAGASCIEVPGTKGVSEPSGKAPKFDLVLIDAPCSGTGTLRRSPDIKWRLLPEAIDHYVALQKGLIRKYLSWLRPGGRLVYVTCSTLREENENVVEGVLSEGTIRPIRADEVFGRLKIPSQGIATNEGYFRTGGGRNGWDIFFAVSLEV